MIVFKNHDKTCLKQEPHYLSCYSHFVSLLKCHCCLLFASTASIKAVGNAINLEYLVGCPSSGIRLFKKTDQQNLESRCLFGFVSASRSVRVFLIALQTKCSGA